MPGKLHNSHQFFINSFSGKPVINIPALAGGHFPKDNTGTAVYFKGKTAIVFAFQVQKQLKAIKIWPSPADELLRKRYAIIQKFISKSDADYFSDVFYLEEAMLLGEVSYDVLLMNWVGRQNVKEYIYSNIDQPEKIHALAEKILGLHRDLNNQGISHGHFHAGNIHIDAGNNLKLTGYDALFIKDELEEETICRLYPDYSHPSGRQKGIKADYFAALILYLATKAIAYDSVLLGRYKVGFQEGFLFNAADFLNVKDAIIYKQLKKLKYPEIDALLEILVMYCEELNPENLQPFYSYLQKEEPGIITTDTTPKEILITAASGKIEALKHTDISSNTEPIKADAQTHTEDDLTADLKKNATGEILITKRMLQPPVSIEPKQMYVEPSASNAPAAEGEIRITKQMVLPPVSVGPVQIYVEPLINNIPVTEEEIRIIKEPLQPLINELPEQTFVEPVADGIAVTHLLQEDVAAAETLPAEEFTLKNATEKNTEEVFEKRKGPYVKIPEPVRDILNQEVAQARILPVKGFSEEEIVEESLAEEITKEAGDKLFVNTTGSKKAKGRGFVPVAGGTEKKINNKVYRTTQARQKKKATVGAIFTVVLLLIAGYFFGEFTDNYKTNSFQPGTDPGAVTKEPGQNTVPVEKEQNKPAAIQKVANDSTAEKLAKPSIAVNKETVDTTGTLVSHSETVLAEGKTPLNTDSGDIHSADTQDIISMHKQMPKIIIKNTTDSSDKGATSFKIASPPKE